ncbi:MAG TPA: Rieske (2Fe-2S) protein [Methylomirabilota bacterium]
MLRGALAIGVGLPLLDLCARAIPEAAAQGDPKSQRPQNGDRFVFRTGDQTGKVIKVADIPIGGPPVPAFPMDPTSGVVRDGSRLNQLLLVRLASAELSEETRGRAADGVVAYSGVCTHTGCDITLWKAESIRFRCPCHESEFDPKDAGRVVGGPAPRRLPRVPVKVVDGVPVAAAGFLGRPGFQPT